MHFGMGPGGWRQAGQVLPNALTMIPSDQCAFGSRTVWTYVALLQLTRETRSLKRKIALITVNIRFVVVLRLRYQHDSTFNSLVRTTLSAIPFCIVRNGHSYLR